MQKPRNANKNLAQALLGKSDRNEKSSNSFKEKREESKSFGSGQFQQSSYGNDKNASGKTNQKDGLFARMYNKLPTLPRLTAEQPV